MDDPLVKLCDVNGCDTFCVFLKIKKYLLKIRVGYFREECFDDDRRFFLDSVRIQVKRKAKFFAGDWCP